ncbi:MAG: hypothetical protein GX219_09440 [Tissierellia bacterium]|nr:hypothetical protein [Tissierellia bacterium]
MNTRRKKIVPAFVVLMIFLFIVFLYFNASKRVSEFATQQNMNSIYEIYKALKKHFHIEI